MGNEYDWIDSYDNPRRSAKIGDEFVCGMVIAIALFFIFAIFGA